MPRRLFVALDLPDEAGARLARLQDPALRGRWTGPSDFHLTLRFLGDTAKGDVETVREGLARVPRRRVAAHLDHVDVFPSRRKPRVLVLAGTPDPALVVLQRQVEAAAVALGYPSVGRPFLPHVTLARLKGVRPQAVRGFLKAHADVEPLLLETDAFHLYESTLTPEGAVYTRLATFALEDEAAEDEKAEEAPGEAPGEAPSSAPSA